LQLLQLLTVCLLSLKESDQLANLNWKDLEKPLPIVASDKSGTTKETLEKERKKPEKQLRRITDLDLFNLEFYNTKSCNRMQINLYQILYLYAS